MTHHPLRALPPNAFSFSSSRRKLCLTFFLLSLSILSLSIWFLFSSFPRLNQFIHLQHHHQLQHHLLPLNLSSTFANWLDPASIVPSNLNSSSLFRLPSFLSDHPRLLNFKPFQKILPLQPPSFAPHPILPLLLAARSAWKSVLLNQPTSLSNARSLYQKRHHPLRPPPGYNAWYSFALKRNFTLIDRFDSLMADLNKFRDLAPSEIKRRTDQLAKLDGVTLVRIHPNLIVETKSSSNRPAPGQSIKAILENILHDSDWNLSLSAPVDFAINEYPQPRVLPPLSRSVLGQEFSYLPQSVRDLHAAQDPERSPSLDGFKSLWGQDGNVWDAYRRACPPGSAARRWVETLKAAESQTGAIAAGGGWAFNHQLGNQQHLAPHQFSRRRELHPSGTAPLPSRTELTFLSDLESNTSFCDQPSTHHLHSAFFNDQRSIEHLYPLFSPSKPQGFADILVPFHYHHSPPAEFAYDHDFSIGLTKTSTDLDWSNKSDKLYWHGKLTRGANTPPGHMSSFQKQRLVKLVSNDTQSTAVTLNSVAHHQGETDPSRRLHMNRVLISLNTTSSTLVSVSESAMVVDPLLLDIAIACDPSAGECKSYDSQGYFTRPPQPLSEAWKFKMVLDLDDVGFSPLFGALMASNSAVVKMSVHQEFWRDWIQPWYHFIPLSSSFAELHNIISFFLGIPEPLQSKALPIRTYHQRTPDRQPSETRAGQPAATTVEPEDTLKNFDSDQELRNIADNGKDWKSRHMRQEDMEVYMFRLLIEWVRLLGISSEPTSPTSPS